MRVLRRILLGLVCLLLGGWGAAALWFDGPTSRPLAGMLAAAFFLLILVLPQRSTRGLVAGGMLIGFRQRKWL